MATQELKYAACGACKRYNGFKAKCEKYGHQVFIRDSACDSIEGW